MVQTIRKDTEKDYELAADHRDRFTSLNTQGLPQENDLTISIEFEVVTRVAIKVTTRKDMQLLWLSGLCIRLEGNVSRTKHIAFGHSHQQGSG